MIMQPMFSVAYDQAHDIYDEAHGPSAIQFRPNLFIFSYVIARAIDEPGPYGMVFGSW